MRHCNKILFIYISLITLSQCVNASQSASDAVGVINAMGKIVDKFVSLAGSDDNRDNYSDGFMNLGGSDSHYSDAKRRRESGYDVMDSAGAKRQRTDNGFERVGGSGANNAANNVVINLAGGMMGGNPIGGLPNNEYRERRYVKTPPVQWDGRKNAENKPVDTAGKVFSLDDTPVQWIGKRNTAGHPVDNTGKIVKINNAESFDIGQFNFREGEAKQFVTPEQILSDPCSNPALRQKFLDEARQNPQNAALLDLATQKRNESDLIINHVLQPYVKGQIEQAVQQQEQLAQEEAQFQEKMQAKKASETEKQQHEMRKRQATLIQERISQLLAENDKLRQELLSQNLTPDEIARYEQMALNRVSGRLGMSGALERMASTNPFLSPTDSETQPVTFKGADFNSQIVENATALKPISEVLAEDAQGAVPLSDALLNTSAYNFGAGGAGKFASFFEAPTSIDTLDNIQQSTPERFKGFFNQI